MFFIGFCLLDTPDGDIHVLEEKWIVQPGNIGRKKIFGLPDAGNAAVNKKLRDDRVNVEGVT